MSVKIEEVVTDEKNLPPNVISIQHLFIIHLDIDHDLFTPIFAVSRVSGWIAHILEQYANNRLIRPRADYIGPGMQKYIPINEDNKYNNSKDGRHFHMLAL